MKKDTTESFWNWLENNAKEDTKRNCYGETISIFHVPHEKMKDFMSEYYGALVTTEGVWDSWDCAGLDSGDTMECIVGRVDPCDGKYHYHMRGSDYDTGIYESGPCGMVDCECYVPFDTGTLYYMNDRVCNVQGPRLRRDRKEYVAVFEKQAA